MSDVRRSSYTSGVVHTHSGYAKGNINKEFLNALANGKIGVEGKIAALKAKEQELYAQFGKATYEEFIAEIRSLFNDEDREVIDRFQANKLNNSLQQFASSNSELLNQQVKIIVNYKGDNNIKLKLTDQAKEGLDLGFEGVFTAKAIKEWFNERFKGHRFISSSDSMIAMDVLLKQMEAEKLIQIQTKPTKSSPTYVDYHKSTIPNYPWGILKQDIENAEVYKEVKDDLVRALQRIKTFIFSELGAGASQELKAAMQAVWSRNFSGSWSDPIRFFASSTKGNFISGIQGSLGEFQTAIIFEYLRNRKSLSPAMAQIVGNVYRRGEQGKTDVQIFKSIGIQVKNVSVIENNEQLSLLRDLKTTIHPSKFAKHLEEPSATYFLDFLANYYFNTSYQDAMEGRMNQLRYRLSYWLIEVMNMAMADVAIGDTVSFYMIGGRYLVPCSRLIEAGKELKLANSIEITSAYKGSDDIGYARHGTKPTKDNPRTPLYELYWTKDENDWTPTGENYSTYHRLIDKDISIRTHFNLFEEIEKYAIW